MLPSFALVAAIALPNPIQLLGEGKTSGSATCRAGDGTLGTWVRSAPGTTVTLEPAVLDAEVGANTPADAMLYCHASSGAEGKIEATNAALIYPKGTELQPLYKLTIYHPAKDQQDPFDTALGPGGAIKAAPFGQAIIFGKHSMLIVPAGWKIESKAAAILPKRASDDADVLDQGGCEVNKMDDEDAFPRYIGTAADDCSVKIDLNALQ
jgi:hypothetical protein